jgi:G6PDH family F420-dependent oxidoreductase
MPDMGLLKTFQQAAGGGKPAAGGLKVCWGADEAQARRTAHRLWRTEGIGGEAMQVLQLPRQFAQLGELVTEERIGEMLPCGPDPDRHAAALREYLDAGYDEVYVNQIGPDQEGFFRFYAEQVLPRL